MDGGRISGRLLRFIVLAALTVLSACAPRGSIVVDPVAATVGDVRPILVATSRVPAADPAVFSGRIAPGMSFAETEISVPPVRKPGTVTFPRGTPDPQTDFLVVANRPIADEAGFIRAINAQLAGKPKNQREIFVFVHGFNTNFAEGLMRQAQMNSDYATPGVSVNYSWPSAASVSAYATDREATLVARDDLDRLIGILSRTNATDIVLSGHSMGAFVVMEAVRQRAIRDGQAGFRKLRSVVLLAPDIDVEVFRRQMRALQGIDVSIFVITSSRDRALRFSALLRGTPDRLGSVSDPMRVSGLPVTLIDLSAVQTQNDSLRHFQAATSPVMISLIQGTGSIGAQVLEDEERKSRFMAAGVVFQDLRGVARAPFAQ